MLPAIADLVEIIGTIRMVDNGLVVFPKQVLAALPSGPKISNGNLQEADNDHRRLSKREIAVLTAMTDGLSNKAIARRLGISFHTVKFHVASILEKLEAETPCQARRRRCRDPRRRRYGDRGEGAQGSRRRCVARDPGRG
jgi:DNA-binding NarL/FixJ family response regulator